MAENETTVIERDRFNLSRKELLADYAAISAKRRGAAEVNAIRHQSVQFLDILAFEATSGEFEWKGLRESLWNSMLSDLELDGFQFIPLAEIGRVLLLNPFVNGDQELGLYILESAVAKLPANLKSRRFRLLILQRKVQLGHNEDVLSLLGDWKDLRKTHGSYLETEIKNPFTIAASEPEKAEIEDWLRDFNKSFIFQGLSPVILRDGGGLPFDRLAPAELPANVSNSTETPRVSVVLTAFQPSKEELLTSVNSILDQTLTSIELIIVDDASGSEYDSTFDEVKQLDNRIRIIRLETNGGTYAARNIGIREARGEYFTGQDDDDWSHPERLHHQVQFLDSNSESIGCRVNGITCTPNLSKLRLGYKPEGSNASSLMVRTRDVREVGGFAEWRKAADTELVKRMERVFNASVVDIPLPLTVIRILPDSLSRSEFRAGWSHPARRQLKSSYAQWHSTASADDLKIGDERLPSVYVPRRFRQGTPGRTSYNVVFAGDWRQFGGPQKSMIEEIKALTEAGYSVAILHLEAPRFMSTVSKPMNPVIQGMVNRGEVDEILYDDDLDVELLVLRYPPILQFAPNEPSGFQTQRMFILANQAPSELDGSDVRYLVRDCLDNARRNFCEDVTWVPQGPQVREFITAYLNAGELEDFDIPGIVKLSEWETNIPRRRRGLLPVVGRHSRDNSMKWPEEKDTLTSVYPTDGSIDIRIMGGGQVPLSVLGNKTLPSNWVVFPTNAMPANAFLRTLDFFVFFQHSKAVEAFGRAVLEAIAANLVVILPPHYEKVFGEAAIYCEPAEVSSVVSQFYGDAELYESQQIKALKVLQENFTYEAYVRRISQYIDSPKKGIK